MSPQQVQTPGDESHLPPQERKSVTDVPVTPDIRRDTYNDQPSKAERLRQGYFPPQPGTAKQHAIRQTIAPSSSQQLQKRNLTTGDGASPSRRNGSVPAHRRVLSATFTVPQLLQYDKDGQWVSLCSSLPLLDSSRSLGAETRGSRPSLNACQ